MKIRRAINENKSNSIGWFYYRKILSNIPIVDGMPIKLTQNMSVSLVLAIGTNGKIVSSEFRNGTECLPLDIENEQCLISDSLSSAVFVECQNTKLGFNWEDTKYSFPGNIFPIHPIKKSIRFELPNKYFTVSISQIPLSVSVAATAYILQGATVSSIYILKIQKGVGETKASLYVILSKNKKH